MPAALLWQTPWSERLKRTLRVLLFVYVTLVICPLQYWSWEAFPDSSWYFAVNYAAAHHMVAGRDFVFTAGPLAYLALPEDIGSNLAQGLACLALLWMVAAAIMWKLVFCSGFRLRNVAFFSIFLGFSAPLYQYPTPLGPADLLRTCALVLLLLFQLRGGINKYLTALALMGLIPLIKFFGMLSAGAVIAGLIAHRMVVRSRGAWREIMLAATVAPVVAVIGLRLATESFQTLAEYFQWSMELSRGYNLAMSIVGSPVELVAALEALLLVAVAWWIVAGGNARTALFFAFVLALPLLLSFKHGFVRQDVHIANFFCFIAVILALAALAAPLATGRAVATFGVILLLFVTIWQDNVARAVGLARAVAAVTGVRISLIVGHTLRFGHLPAMLKAKAQQAFPPELRLEPEIKSIVGQEPIASLSMVYSNAPLDGLNLRVYPVILRYAAYTPELDRLNADWVRDKGPQFLIFDGTSIDKRHPWTETPRMWLEVYRWYDLRLLAAHNLLLERRSEPRFERFDSLAQSHVKIGQPFEIPAPSRSIVFWALHCSLSRSGKLRELFFRVPEVTMRVEKGSGESQVFRALPAVLGSPSPGNYLPNNLAEFALIFAPEEKHGASVKKLTFGGPGISAYNPECDLEFLRPVR